jgi:hypothetical protein
MMKPALMIRTTRALTMLKLALMLTLASIAMMTTIVLLLTWAPRMEMMALMMTFAMSDDQTEHRQFDALCYEDVRLLVVRNPVAGERDVLAMEVKLAHHKGAKRKPMP